MSKKSRLRRFGRQENVIPNASEESSKLRTSHRPRKIATPSARNDKIVLITTISLVIIVIGILAFSIFQPGLPSGHDIGAHDVRAKLFDKALRQGQFPVRWIEGIRPGLSEPLFNFYQSGVYYWISAVHYFIPSFAISMKVAVFLLWILGGAFTFLLAKRFGKIPATLSSCLFVLTPYILSDIYVRASYPELGAIAFVPGVFWAMDRLLSGSKLIYLPILSLLLGLIILFHLPTLVIIAPVLISFLVLKIIQKEFSLKSLVYFGLSILLALGLASFYILPAIFEIQYINSQLLSSGYYDFHQHFVYPQQLFSLNWGYGISVPGPNDGMSFQFGIVQWLIIAVSFAVIFATNWIKSAKKIKPYLIFWLLMLLYAVYFMHDISLPFWDSFSFMSFIQYPWRFLLVVPLATSFMAAVLLSLVTNKSYQVGMALIIIIFAFICYKDYLKPSTFLPDSYFNRIEVTDENTYLEPGYMPKEISQTPKGEIKPFDLIKGQGQIEVDKITDTEFFLNSNSSQDLVLRVNSHYFPGWIASIDDQSVSIDHNNPYDYMDLVVPAGIHKIRLEFKNTLIREFGNLISVLSITGLGLLIVWSRLERRD